MKPAKIDSSLIELAKEGDAIAFRAIVEAYKDVSLSLACTILKDEAEAEDVLQESFIRVYKNLSAFRMESNFSTWLYRIVVNTAKSAAFKRKSKLALTKEPVYEVENYKQKDQAHYINLALMRLKKDEALTLRLHYLSELTVKEIHEVTGHGESKIKMDLLRGRKSFEKALNKILGKEMNHLL